jgi:YebC/PmpR family DNA-binding regulatory protein
MSGHNKWAGIKHRKAAVDKKKGVAFSKYARMIMSAVKQGGPDPDSNFKLQFSIEKARAVNMPRENIERAIKRGAGDGEGESFEDLVYEGYGPGGVAFRVDALTDNRNRTAPEMRSIFESHGGRMGTAGSVARLFTALAVFRIPAEGFSEDRVMELAVDGGADDFAQEGDAWVLKAPAAGFVGVRDALVRAKITPTSSGIEQVPNLTTAVNDEETARKLIALHDELDENDDVQNVWMNADIPDAIIAKLNG